MSVINRDCFVVGVFIGLLLCSLLMLLFPKGSVCEVVIGYGNGNREHVQYGVVVTKDWGV